MYDALEIRDGAAADAALLQPPLCGDDLAAGATVQSSGQSMFVTFASDHAVEESGFAAAVSFAPFSPVACPGGCSGNGACNDAVGVCTCDDGWRGDACDVADTLCSGTVAIDADGAVISDGSGSTDYLAGMACEWTVTAPAGSVVQLAFDEFALE